MKPKKKPSLFGGSILPYIFIVVAIFFVISTIRMGSNGSGPVKVTQEQFIALAAEGKVESHEWKTSGSRKIVEIKANIKDGDPVMLKVHENQLTAGSKLGDALQKLPPPQKVTEKGPSFGSILLSFLPFILIFGFIFWMISRAARGQVNGVTKFLQARARTHNADTTKVTFNDVAGVEEAKQELAEVVEFLQFPERFSALGAKIPRGVLLMGQPGTGKTLLAKAVAGEASVPFYHMSGSEFVEMFVGVGASRVRDLFDQARRNSPSIIFIDELDAAGRQRGAGLGGGHDEKEQTLNQILVEMDGFETGTNVIVIAATNRPDILDPALLRPGRFDRLVVVGMPDVKGREAIAKVHLRGKPLQEDIEAVAKKISEETSGFSGADLAKLVNEAAILAARRKKKQIGLDEFAEAVDRVIAGPELKSKVISAKEKEITAYHEAGHALVGKYTKDADPLQKITIVPRGRMGGYTRFLPKEDRSFATKKELRAHLAVAMGGRAAEEIKFGVDEISTGASNDLEQATKIARRMVTRWGMSEKLGHRTYGNPQELIFLGKELHEERDYSDEVAANIDKEVEEFLNQAYENAVTMIKEHRKVLDRIAQYLILRETVEGEELNKLFEKVPEAEGQKPDGGATES